MKRKLMIGVSMLILLSSIVGYTYWQQYENSRLQPYYKLHEALDNGCQEIVLEGKYDVKKTRDLGKSTLAYTYINIDNVNYEVLISQNTKTNRIRYVFFKGEGTIFDGVTPVVRDNNNLFYTYYYNKGENRLEYPGSDDTAVKPSESFIVTFEQEMKERLKSC